MHFIKYLFFLVLIISVSCKKDKKTNENIETDYSNSILVLNEGLYLQNNASLSLIKDGNSNNEIFTQVNARLLGDTGNDLKKYGNKIYIVVNASSTIEVLNAKTLKVIKQIPMQNAFGIGKQPRSIEFYGGNAFITCFDGYVDVLDTNSLVIENRIAVGSNPEKMAFANNLLYVTNSGGLNAPNVDSTVSIVNLNTFTEIQKITVGKNPGDIFSAGDGNIYVISRGNYSNIPSRMHKINVSNQTVETTYNFNASNIHAFKNDEFLISYYDFNTGDAQILSFNYTSGQVSNSNVLNLDNIQTLYGIHYSQTEDKFYCLDAQSFTNLGYLKIFSSSGELLQTFQVGLNPNNILFL